MLHLSRFKYAASVFALVSALGTPAYADVDPTKVSQAVNAMFDGYGLQVIIASSELQGANVVLKDVAFMPPKGEKESIGDITLNNVSETADGFLIGDISAPAKDYAVPDGTWSFGGASIKNLTLPAAGTTDPIKQMPLYETIEMGPSTFKSKEGVEFINFSGGKGSSKVGADQVMQFDFAIPDLSFDLNAIPQDDPQAKEVITALGIEKLQIAINGKGSWNMVDGRFILSEESFDIKNIGKLNFVADISGYTPKLMAEMRDATKQAGAGATDAEMGAKMMGLMQQLSIGAVSLRFDDASLVSKAFDLASKKMGQPKEALAAQLKGMAPLMFMQLKDPDFSIAATAAISAFVDNPKNLEIKIAPAAPVPVSQLVASGMSAPETLIKQLGVAVVANQ